MSITIRTMLAFSVIVGIAIIVWGLWYPFIYNFAHRDQHEPAPEVHSAATAEPSAQSDNLTESGLFRTLELSPPGGASGYTLLLMQGDTLVSALPGNVFLSGASSRVRVTFGPTHFTHHRCQGGRSFYIATSLGNARPDGSFSCFRDDERANVPPKATPYLAAYEAALESQPQPLIKRSEEVETGNWIPLMAYYDRRYGWHTDDLESFSLEPVPVSEWHVLYLMFYEGSGVDITTLEPPSLRATLAADDNLLSLWNEMEQNLSPQE